MYWKGNYKREKSSRNSDEWQQFCVRDLDVESGKIQTADCYRISSAGVQRVANKTQDSYSSYRDSSSKKRSCKLHAPVNTLRV